MPSRFRRHIRLRTHPPLDAATATLNAPPMAGTVYIMASQKNGTLYIGVT